MTILRKKFIERFGSLNAELKVIFSDIQDSLTNATNTLNEVLSYEKLISNAMLLDLSIMDPIDIINSSLHMFRQVSTDKCISLELPSRILLTDEAILPNDMKLKLIADSHKISQVLSNFVSNALKFTRAGGSVKVSASIRNNEFIASSFIEMNKEVSMNAIQTKLIDCLDKKHHNWSQIDIHWLYMEFQDSGVGIEEKNIKKIFNEIVQFNPNENQDGKGSGLGMFITKGLIDLHCGFVKVESMGINSGTTFSLAIPLFAMKPKNDAVISISQILSRQYSQIHPKEGDQKDNDDEKNDDIDLSDMNILVVDDSVVNLRMVINLLKRFGANCDSATDGAAAVELVKKSLSLIDDDRVAAYDMILLDNLMPIMTGPEACVQIRELGYTNSIFGLTGHALKEDVNHFLNSGADVILTKPLNLSEFRRAVDNRKGLVNSV